MKLLIGALLFLIVINLATLGSYVYYRWTQTAPPLPDHIPPRGMRGPLWHKVDGARLHLSPEQRSQLHHIMQEFREETRDLRYQIMNKEEQVLQMLQTDSIKDEDIEQALLTISELQFEMRKIAIRKLVKAKSFLKPEQQEQFYLSLIQGRFRYPDMKPHAPPESMRRQHKPLKQQITPY